jgi:hypothetical protein
MSIVHLVLRGCRYGRSGPVHALGARMVVLLFLAGIPVPTHPVMHTLPLLHPTVLVLQCTVEGSVLSGHSFCMYV